MGHMLWCARTKNLDYCDCGQESLGAPVVLTPITKLQELSAALQKAESERDAALARVKELEAELASERVEHNMTATHHAHATIALSTLTRLAKEVQRWDNAEDSSGTIAAHKALYAFLATNEPPKDPVREAAKAVVESMANYRNGSADMVPLDDAADALAAALRETEGK